MENLLFLLSTENWPTPIPSVVQFFGIIQWVAGTLFVALLAYYGTKWLVAKRGAGFSGKKTSNLQVIERVSLSAQSMLQLVKAGEKYLVISVTRDKVELLAELDKDSIQVPEESESEGVQVPFNNVLARFLPTQKKEDDEQRDEDGG